MFSQVILIEDLEIGVLRYFEWSVNCTLLKNGFMSTTVEDSRAETETAAASYTFSQIFPA